MKYVAVEYNYIRTIDLMCLEERHVSTHICIWVIFKLKWHIIIIYIKDWTSLIRSVSRVTTVLANVSSVFQLFSFLVVCSDMVSTGSSFVAFFANVNASLVCSHLSCLVCL